jgi:hypothetical protein
LRVCLRKYCFGDTASEQSASDWNSDRLWHQFWRSGLRRQNEVATAL